MTPLLEGVGIALESLRAHKARAALTILGVAIGVMVVMVIGAIVSTIRRSRLPTPRSSRACRR